MKLINPIDYIYFKFYEFISRVKHKDASLGDAALSAYFYLSFLLFLNAIKLYDYFNKKLLLNIDITIIGTIFLLIIISAFNHFRFIKNNNYLKRIQTFENRKSHLKSLTGTILVFLYVILSIYILFK